MDYPYWLSSDGDDAERAPVDPGEAEHVLEWVDEREWVVRRSADEWLAELAAESLARDPLIHGRRLEIVVQNGMIILLGVLASAESPDPAGRRAWSVEGVVDVSHQLTVGEADLGDRWS